MVKSVLGVNHSGLTDWLIQRVSAFIMAVYVIGLILFLVTHPHVAYFEWRSLFSNMWMKVTTLIAFASLLFHAWIGMWTIFTDYVTCYLIRLVLHTIVLLALVAFFFAALLIIWGV